MAAVTIGTGARYAMFGQLNQRAAMRACISGVQMLTMPTNTRTASNSRRASMKQRSWSGPMVFMRSHVAPSRA